MRLGGRCLHGGSCLIIFRFIPSIAMQICGKSGLYLYK
nr:MAG TPA: hypothetical protein [Caudoviricetes sp.]DAY93721.1 MAG TPA: hypothetical protein [Caudoviricetes sp.]